MSLSHPSLHSLLSEIRLRICLCTFFVSKRGNSYLDSLVSIVAVDNLTVKY
jgi:hypothetical protein